MIWRIIRIGGHLVSLLLTCSVVGTGIGFWLGEVTARAWTRSAQISFGEGAAFIGAVAACILAPLLYFGILDSSVSFIEFSTIVACAGIIGSMVAIGGSEIVTPIATAIATVVAAIIVKVRRINGQTLEP